MGCDFFAGMVSGLDSLDFLPRGEMRPLELVRAGGWMVRRFLGEVWASLASAGALEIKPGGGLFTSQIVPQLNRCVNSL